MSHPLWHVEVKIQLINGTAGCVNVQATDCITFREAKSQVMRALAMAELLSKEPPAEAVDPRQQFKVVG